MENTTTTKPGDQVKRGRGRPRKNPASATATTKAGAKASLKPINSYFTSAAQSEITTVTKAPPPPQPQIQLTEQQQQQQQEKQNGMEKGSTEISEEPDVKKPEQKKRRKSAKDENEDYEYEEEEDEDIVDAAASDDEVDSSTEDMDEKKTLSKGKVKQRETPKKTKYIKIADRRNPDGTPVERAKKSLKIKNSLFTVAKRNEDVCKSYWEGDAVYKSFRPPTGDHIESVPREAAAKYFCSPLDTQPNLKVVYKTIAPDRTVSVPPIASERDSTRVGAEDVIVNAGGPIWAVDWCPMKYDGEHATQYIAAATKSPDIKEHTTNVQSPGCAALQIWSLEGLCGGSSPSAALELAILHDYGTVFELQWCPTGAYSSEPSEALPEGRLGLLAAATSSGFVVVWSVPLPSAAARVSTPFVRLDPVFRISIPGAVPTSIEWSLDQQHSSLLVGFSDGYTRAWAPEQCKRDGGGNTVDDYTPFFECFCAPLGVRSVRWSPLLSDVFAVAALSYLPELQIWSLQNPFSPLQSIIPPGCKLICMNIHIYINLLLLLKHIYQEQLNGIR